MSDSQNSNPPRDLAGEVISLLILHTNAKREEISPSTRLQHDLGMDGDDAVDFFDQFSRQFNVDIDALKEDWALHFGPERGGRSQGPLQSPSGLPPRPPGPLACVGHSDFPSLKSVSKKIVGRGKRLLLSAVPAIATGALNRRLCVVQDLDDFVCSGASAVLEALFGLHLRLENIVMVEAD